MVRTRVMAAATVNEWISSRNAAAFGMARKYSGAAPFHLQHPSLALFFKYDLINKVAGCCKVSPAPYLLFHSTNRQTGGAVRQPPARSLYRPPARAGDSVCPSTSHLPLTLPPALEALSVRPPVSRPLPPARPRRRPRLPDSLSCSPAPEVWRPPA